MPDAAADPARSVVLVARSASWRWQINDRGPPAHWPWLLDVAGDAALGTIPRAQGSADRIASAFGVTTFALTANDRGLEMLELRAHYQDGIAVSLNGIEVARRGLPATGDAPRSHGPEWETVYIPVAPSLLHLGPNVLAVEVHPSRRHAAPSFEAELVGRRDLGIVRGPMLVHVGASTATIRVDTDPGVEAILEWGTGGALDHRMTSRPAASHVFELKELTNAITYRVRAGGEASALETFHVMPHAGDVMRIGVYGDVRGGHDIHRKLVENMLGEGLDLVAVTGDMVLRGADRGDWQRFYAITQPLLAQVLYLPAVGNHDLGADELFTLPSDPRWYSFDLADVHLVFLDSNAYERVEQETWLDADLAAARSRHVRAIVAFTHDGPFSRGLHRGNTLARTRYVPILTRHHVDLLASGHDHLYQRGTAQGLAYVVSGGGGASLYAITCGVAGTPRCKVDDGMQAIFREHHYLVLTVTATHLELCARRPDGRLLEPCTRSSLWRP